MIIIDEEAITTFYTTLKTQPMLDGKYCMHFKLATYQNHPRLSDIIVTATQQHMAMHDPHLYFCEDGEAFLMATDITVRQSMRIMLDVATALDIDRADEIADFYDLPIQKGLVYKILDQKLVSRFKKNQEQQKKQQQEAAQIKRRQILHDVSSNSTQTITVRRAKRDAAEIMIIEDDPFSRRLVENVLQKQYRLTELATADHALATYADLAPDILFLDINLPDVTGHDLLERIMSFDPDAYVIMLSGNSDRENIMQAMNLGAKGFVAKPFNRDKLFQYIKRCPTITS